MPKGPRGEKRPADVIGNAVHVMQIATGLITERVLDPGKEYARKGGLIGGPKRAAKLSKKAPRGNRQQSGKDATGQEAVSLSTDPH
jgi:hypothetical protein